MCFLSDYSQLVTFNMHVRLPFPLFTTANPTGEIRVPVSLSINYRHQQDKLPNFRATLHGRHTVGDIRASAYTIIMNTNTVKVWIRDFENPSVQIHRVSHVENLPKVGVCNFGRWNIHWSKAKYFGTLMRTDTRSHLIRHTTSDSRSPSLQNVPFGTSKTLRMGCEWTRNNSFCIWLEIFRTVQICILVFRVKPYYTVSGLFNDSDENDATSILGNPYDRIPERVASMMVGLKREAACTFETLVPTHHTTVDHNPDRNMHQLLVHGFLLLLSV